MSQCALITSLGMVDFSNSTVVLLSQATTLMVSGDVIIRDDVFLSASDSNLQILGAVSFLNMSTSTMDYTTIIQQFSGATLRIGGQHRMNVRKFKEKTMLKLITCIGHER